MPVLKVICPSELHSVLCLEYMAGSSILRFFCAMPNIEILVFV